ncbi:2-hydroxyacyl-CoA dehydratase [Tissierella creatinini]|nr:2-hydroxyacyl-CoA dehydratase [Tissierella creatinini]TJX63753.1 2-hydroxyacyl-CoA dehydratase [Soehngenia saccharolytica]
MNELDKRISSIKNIKEDGNKIAGTFCSFTPLEVLDAANVNPVNLSSYNNDLIKYGESDLPRNLCPLVKSSYGAIISNNNKFAELADLIIGQASCDGKKKMYELLENYKETYIMQLPQGVDRPYSSSMWLSEVNYLIKYLENKYGIDITEDKLRQAALLRNKIKSLYNQLFSLSKLDPPPISGYDTYKIIEDAELNLNLNDRCEKMRKTIDSILDTYKSSSSSNNKGKKRILITGCPIGGVLEKVVKPIESNDGLVVCFENCSGIKLYRNLVNADLDNIVKAIADSYLNIGCAVMSPNTKRMDLLPELIEEFKVDGVVEVVLQTCHSYSIESKAVKKLVTNLDKPYLMIETDFSETNIEQIRTRITAFLEML